MWKQIWCLINLFLNYCRELNKWNTLCNIPQLYSICIANSDAYLPHLLNTIKINIYILYILYLNILINVYMLLFTVHTKSESAASTYKQVKRRPKEKTSWDHTAKSHSTLHYHKSFLSHHSCKYTDEFIYIYIYFLRFSFWYFLFYFILSLLLLFTNRTIYSL